MVEVEIMPSAKEDLQEIIDYVFLQSVQNAEDLYKKILYKIDSLQYHPETGKIVKEIANPQIREINIYHFRIIYKLSALKVEVITIHHSARLLSNNPNAINLFE